MRIIAISGKASSGKDTLALILKEELKSLEIFPFAEELKRIACELWGISPEVMATYEGKAAQREKLIQLGAAIRAIDEGTWVNLVIKKIKASNADYVIIPDLRFRDELYRLLLEFSDKVDLIRISASENLRLKRMGPDRAKEYIAKGFYADKSETAFDFMEEGYKGPEWREITKYGSIINNDFDSKDKLKENALAWMNSTREIFDMTSVTFAARLIA